METIINSIKETWSKLSLYAKIAGGVIIFTIFFSLLFLIMFSPGNYQPLYTNLDLNDAAAITEVLDENNIAYQIGDNGTSILVPADLVHQTRLTLASFGLPQGGIVGFETFDTTRLGETDADRQLRYQIALEGELTRTIRSLKEISDARIHIVISPRSLFIQNDQPSTASVLLDLQPGVVLSNNQVRGITHLIATSVERLSPENITIVDTRGNVLNDFSGSTGLDGSIISQRLEIKAAFEKQLTTNIVAMLERIYGYGQVVAQINVDLDFDTIEKYDEVYTAPNRDSGLIRSEQWYTEFSLDGLGAEGIPGVDANIPGYVELEDISQQGFSRQESIINYDLNRSEIYQTTPPGSIKNMSVAVWINGELTQNDLDLVENSIAGALGLNFDRGDYISVNSVLFETDISFTTVDDYVPDSQFSWIYIAIAGLLILVIAIIVIRKKRSQIDVIEQISATTEGEGTEERKLSPEEKAKLDTLQKLKHYASEKPKEFSQMIRSWLLDD